MDLIQAQRDLSDHDRAIFNAELQRRAKSIVLAYFLWFFLGGLGVHNFYMGKVLWGLFYLILTIIGWGFLLVAGSSPETTNGMLAAGVLALAVLGTFLLWDLFTIPRQLKQRHERIEQELLNKLGTS